MLKMLIPLPHFDIMLPMNTVRSNFFRFALLTWLVLLAACTSLSPWPEPPTVSVTNIELQNAASGNSSVIIRLSVSNPNAVVMPIEGLQYQLQLNGHRVLEGVSSDVDRIPAFGTADLELQARADLVGMFSLISSLMSGATRQVDYQLETRISVEGLWRPVTLRSSGTLPMSVSF